MIDFFWLILAGIILFIIGFVLYEKFKPNPLHYLGLALWLIGIVLIAAGLLVFAL
jgi:uncharacterized membrane protein HdeD (DUF308 family)